MMETRVKVGIVSCSGEGRPEGTVCRMACRRLLEQATDKTVTICLPLFIAGGREERTFAMKYPTITVDGCEKRCAARATETLSAKPRMTLLIPEILRKHGLAVPNKRRDYGPDEEPVIRAVIEELAGAVETVLAQI